jgi:hypothetical protein
MSAIQRIKGQGKIHKHVKNADGDYTCEYCDYVTPKQSTMSEHFARLHPVAAGRQLHAFECEHCERRFQTSTQRQHHIINKHSEASYCCPLKACGKMSKNHTTMLTHYVNRHMDKNLCIVIDAENNVQCKCCQKYMKMASVSYHLAKCNPLSPFFQGSIMQDGGNDVLLFKPKMLSI